MLQRLLPLALAVVVGATPIAREICRVSCAGHHASTSSPHAEHAAGAMAGHEMPDHAAHQASLQPDSQHADTPSCSVSLSAARHGCDHGNESLASAPVTRLAIDSPAVMPQVARPTGPTAIDARLAAGRAPALGSIPIARRTPLRV